MHQQHQMQQTSLMAFENIKPKLGKRQTIILNAMRELCELYGDATDQEITNHLMQTDPNYVRPRRHELVNRYKIVRFSQQRICKITKSTSMAWRII